MAAGLLVATASGQTAARGVLDWKALIPSPTPTARPTPAPPDSEKAKEKGKDKEEPLPLKGERKLEFTTDEGTWTSLDVSPDGKTIVFDLIGNLYTIPISGGEATRITNTGLGFNIQPSYSPDGSWIAFLSDRDGAANLWISKPDGSAAKKLSDEKQAGFVCPAWTPDGEYVLVTRRTEASAQEIWMYHVKGGAGVQVTKGGAISGNLDRPDTLEPTIGAVASPDGRYFYYSKSARSQWQMDAPLPFFQVARRDRVTGDEDLLTHARGSGMRPVISPDGTKLVYGTRYDSQTGLRILDLATGDDRWLKYPIQRDDQEFAISLLPGYAFTPDGRDVVVSSGGKIHRVNVNTREDRLIPFTVHVSQDLGPKLDFPRRVEDGPTVRARLIQSPTQSPDGKRLAFSALADLYVMDLPNGIPRRITKGSGREFQPVWSPDGRWLAYVTWSAEGGGDIWKMRADGSGEPQRLTRASAFYMDPSWTRDGSRIVALRAPRQRVLENSLLVVFGQKGEPFDLIWVSSGGGEAHLIAPARGVGRPHFTTEEGRVYIHDEAALISMRFDGSDRRTHLKVAGKALDDSSPKDILLSPDGKMALVLLRTHLYLIPVPRVGGEALTVNLDSSSLPVKRLTDVGADYFAWADGGSTITWALGSKFFRLKLSAVSFEKEKKDQEKPGSEKTEKERTTTEDETAKKKEKLPVEEISVVVERPRHRSKGVIVLRGAQVITMKGIEVIREADVVVTDNRITALGPPGSVKIPEKAKVWDVHGMTIMPGMIDTHDHWNRRLFGDVLDMENWDFLAHLAYGVTTGRDPQTSTNDIFAYQDLVETGEILGPRAFSTGPGVFWNTDFQSADEAYDRVSKYAAFYRTHMIKSYMVGNRRQREFVVDACKKLQVMPTTEGGGDLMLDLTHAVDGFAGNEHALPVVPIYKDVVELMAQSKITYTPTLLVGYGGPQAENDFFERYDVHEDPKARRFLSHSFLDAVTQRRSWYRQSEFHYPQVAAGAGRIIRSGGRVCIGGHGQLPGLGTQWEVWALTSGGVSNHDALRAATLSGAEAIGYAQDLGSLEVGKLADLIVLAKNPLEDIHNTNTIRYVMKDGELFEGDTLNEVWPEQKPLAPLWFWNDKP